MFRLFDLIFCEAKDELVLELRYIPASILFFSREIVLSLDDEEVSLLCYLALQ